MGEWEDPNPLLGDQFSTKNPAHSLKFEDTSTSSPSGTNTKIVNKYDLTPSGIMVAMSLEAKSLGPEICPQLGAASCLFEKPGAEIVTFREDPCYSEVKIRQ